MPIHEVIKEIGETCGECIVKHCGDEKKAFIGRLDPMARGLFIILTGAELSLQSKYLTTKKTYQFSFVVGLQTDSDDVLGLLIDKSSETLSIEHLIENIESFPTSYEQKYHRYSSFQPKKKFTDGKRYPLWWWTANKLDCEEEPTKPVEMFSKRIISVDHIDGATLKANILTNLSKLNPEHKFRTSEIIKMWEDEPMFDTIVVTCEFEVSSGFYIRQFVQDLSNSIKHPLMVTDINRLSIE